MLQDPNVLVTFDKVHNPLRLPRETASEPDKPQESQECNLAGWCVILFDTFLKLPPMCGDAQWGIIWGSKHVETANHHCLVRCFCSRHPILRQPMPQTQTKLPPSDLVMVFPYKAQRLDTSAAPLMYSDVLFSPMLQWYWSDFAWTLPDDLDAESWLEHSQPGYMCFTNMQTYANMVAWNTSCTRPHPNF